MSPMTAEAQTTLAAGVRAPADARVWLTEQPAVRILPEDTVQDALLVLSELVTNAIRHGEPEVDVTLTVRPDRVRVAVRDHGAALTLPRLEPVGTARTTGRGLLIVDMTSLDWGVEAERDATGKTVWADIAVA